MNAELDRLRRELIEFEMEHYEEQLKDATFDELEMYMMDTDDENKHEMYISLVFPWMIINELIVNDVETIFEVFAKQKMNKVKNAHVRKLFSSWADAITSIFEIVSIANSKEIEVRDHTTDETYSIKY